MGLIPKFFYDGTSEPESFLYLRLTMLKLAVAVALGLWLQFGWWGWHPAASVSVIFLAMVFIFLAEMLIEIAFENERSLGGSVVVTDDGSDA